MHHTLHLCSVREGADELAAVVHPRRGLALVRDLIPGFTGDVRDILAEDLLEKLESLAETTDDGAFRDPDSATYGAPYRHPRMIWGIGLNYVEHASDLSEGVPEEPASFIKADHTVIGPGEDIPLPAQSERTTTEAEVAVVIGRYCRNVEVADALDYVAGVVPVLDQTAEDILQRNPRFLTRAKNFPGFFSFGPRIVPLAEAVGDGTLADVQVSTVVNGEVRRTNTVSHMRYSPEYLISFHSKVMPLYPGDIISTGTPGAIHVQPGDTAECRVSGVGTLSNPVSSAN
ncbi:fumarylacetoacetate hydrolase family protein [Arthrobacter crystallopoietes]|uniref:2-keto-4-pentenoate hydratase/2-oxohepta-3-ene-1,7-dioic acid hydratase (Catechol pathway) n=1 Tax=Crystallibacter crystallopoietes TaxID=37928 RepID=A0A1H1AND1_9MICC|nr:fumarylacetoacetate hydrolase family protein [Arthrobacter crystallopoietes]SDQ41268.1 2-keto-4-pentenoate hydratase/2-oxohepta-3-ene-1,7-dioic acid hydratase (catechol pathway) [Arthrobacter crystallopoietes]